MCRINFWRKKERKKERIIIIIIIIIIRNGANTISLQTSFGDLIILPDANEEGQYNTSVKFKVLQENILVY